MKRFILYFVGLFIFIGSYELHYCLRVLHITPGPPALRYYDSNYIDDIVLKTRRTEKRGVLALNVEFTNKRLWTNNNVSIHLIFYEYLHNEYRRSFVEMHYKVCDLILKDPILGPLIRKTDVTVCPLPPGRYRMMNMTFNQQFPSVFPFEKGRCELTGNLEPSGKEFVRADLVATFEMKDKL